MTVVDPVQILIDDNLITDPIIRTKLFAPPFSPNLVSRPRLTKTLNKGLDCKLILVSAAAGFGKTTLLSEWFHLLKQERASSLSIAWLSLDTGDNDPYRFWNYVLSAIEPTVPGVKDQLTPFLLSHQANALENLLTALLNVLERFSQPTVASLQQKFVLAIDDYHVIHNEAIHVSMAFLLDHLPANTHIVIASRGDPRLPIARLRARNQLLELHTSDLAFSNDETTEFFNRRLGLLLSPEQVLDLQRRVEGWVTGLQLSALSAGESKNVFEVFQNFNGDDRNVADFLISEVLDRLPAEITNFLLETSILARLNGSLCDAVTGGTDSQGILELLERMHLFLVPLDHKRTWYRYQHLFADLIQTRLKQTKLDRMSLLHHRACEWYENQAMPLEAIPHALAAQDFVHAADLVEQNYRKVISHGEFFALSACLDALPKSLFDTSPKLLIARAWTMIGADQPNAIEPYLEAAERAINNLGQDQIVLTRTSLGPEVTAIRATAAGQRGDVLKGIELANQAILQTTGNDSLLRSWVMNAVGTVFARGQDPSSTIHRLTDSITVSHTEGNFATELISLYHLAKQYQSQGWLHKAMEVHQQASSLNAGQGYKDLPYAGIAKIGMGDLQREWNDLEAAQQSILSGIEQIQQGLGVEFLAKGYISLARVKQAQGDFPSSLQILDKAAFLARKKRSLRNVEVVDAYLARINLLAGDKKAAFYWAKTDGLRNNREDLPLYEVQSTTLARVLAEQGKSDQALQILDQLFKLTSSLGRTGTVIEILALRSMILFTQHQEELGFRVLDEALVLGMSDGYIRVFVDEGRAMADILNHHLQAKRTKAPAIPPSQVEYEKMLLSVLGYVTKQDEDRDRESRQFIFQERLSEREIEVCRLLLAGYTNAMIAESFCVSVNTIKSHRKNIYDKLEVNTLGHAIHKIRELNIL